MVFNGDSGNIDICTLADKPNKTNDTSFPLADKAMYANMGLREIFRAIYQVYGGWTVQDSNVSGTDRVSTDLLNDGTRFYAFATVAFLKGMEYTDEDGNDWALTPITLEEIRDMGYAEDEFMDTPGDPQYYRPVKNGVMIYPAWYTSKSTVTNGLTALIGAQDISPFTAASTSTSPGYDSLAGHEAVAEFMSFRYSDDNDKTNRDRREAAWLRALGAIKAHYKRKFMEMKTAIRKKPMGNGYADQFIS